MKMNLKGSPPKSTVEKVEAVGERGLELPLSLQDGLYCLQTRITNMLIPW
jgi:hypothetical protein